MSKVLETINLPNSEKLEISLASYLGNGRDYGIFFLKNRIFSLPTSERPTDRRTFQVKLILKGESVREIIKSTKPKPIIIGERELTVRIKKESAVEKSLGRKHSLTKISETDEITEEDDIFQQVSAYRQGLINAPTKFITKERQEKLFFHFTGIVSDYYEERSESCSSCKMGNIKKTDEHLECYNCGGKGFHIFGDFNYTRLIRDFAQKEFNEARARLVRKFNRERIRPFIHKGSEYIEFTKETAASWGPPHTIETPNGIEKYYCYASVGKTKKWNSEDNKPYAIIDPADFTSSSIPWGFIIPGFTKENQNNEIYRLTKNEKRKLFRSFPEWVKNYVHRMIFKPRFTSVEQIIQQEMPWKVYLAGTDDVSYTKWFPTKKDAMRELERLRRMQPCDFSKDILKMKYIFTN